jgi:type IV pilus assembly protein PilA
VPSTLPRLVRDERGFTLTEILVVTLIIGVLAAVTLPMFLGQSQKGSDAEAKSNARNLVTYMDSCYVPNEDFTKCATQADSEAESIDWGTGPGQVSVVDVDKDSYEIEAVSRAKTNGANHTFTIERAIGSGMDRSCTGAGGCRNGTW